MSETGTLKIGWGHVNITPDQPVQIAGQFHVRVSEGVRDPVTSTALALEGPGGEQAVLVSCDLVSISDDLRDAVRAKAAAAAPGLDPMMICVSATHTHTAPEVRPERSSTAANVSGGVGLDLGTMEPAAYVDWASGLIADAIGKAWKGRRPGGVSFGLGHAVVGHNRRWTSFDGVSTMYGNTNQPSFSHVEGFEDHSVNILAAFDAQDKLTGLVVNVACPSQVSESEFMVSADYWHETRLEIKRRLGQDVFVLGQCSAAGDQSPHDIVFKAAEARMLEMLGRSKREDIAVRIADAVDKVLPVLRKKIERAPKMAHRVEKTGVKRRLLGEADVAEALAEAANWRAKEKEARAALEANPELKKQPRWYVDVSRACRRARWYEGVKARFEEEKVVPLYPVEFHVIRLGDMAFATNPFEYYIDFGVQIKARSKAVQTFLIQLTGSGTYVPTQRAVAGKSYGAVPASTPVGPEGGRELAEKTIAVIEQLWA
ncbi:MAG TPA: hypothetical protein P5137_07850 [Candidatus Brocadiia bacterium]|nr:hypothetical protein [Candidatus Brocadiia bacterium]